MPIYEYECEKCGTTFETMQSVSAKPLKTCQGIGCDNKESGKVHRLISASGFILKGSGWYATDYPSEARKKGWEQEGGQSQPKPEAAEAPAASKESAAATQESAAAKPAPQKPRQKNPYSGGRSKKVKTAK